MNLLGINISHHGSSCLLQNGKITYFLEEERVSRIKNHSISYSDLKFYGIDVLKKHTTKIDYLIFSSYGRDGICYVSESTLNEWISIVQTRGHEYFSKLFLGGGIRIENENDIYEHDILIIHSILKQMDENSITVGNVIFEHNKHHFYHAASAFYSSGFEESCSLVLDGGGTFSLENYIEFEKLNFRTPFREKESIYKCSEDSIESLYTHYSHNFTRSLEYDFLAKENVGKWEKTYSHNMSCGDLFNFVSCNLLGFKSGDDSGKTMGLSSYYQKPFPIDLQNEWFYELHGEMVSDSKLFKTLSSLAHYNFKVSDTNIEHASMISKKLQNETKNHTLYLINKSLSITGSKNIVLSGGYFLNCVNNYEYKKLLQSHVNIYIDPIPHDAGTALGAVQYAWHKITGKKPEPLKNLFIGP